MKLFTSLVLLLALVAIGNAWVDEGFFTDPAHPGKCVDEDLILSPGETGKPHGECVSVSCHSADGYASRRGCGSTIASPPCTVGAAKYPDAAYPDCCEMEIICPDDNGPLSYSRIG